MEASNRRDIRNLNIWKNHVSRELIKYKESIFEADVSKRKESDLSMKCEAIFYEIMQLNPTADFNIIKKRRGGTLRFPIYICNKLNETEIDVLDLSVRSSNCLHRAGFRTIGDLIEHINGREDLKRIKNCGTKSINEIMEQLFCYQYSQMEQSKKMKYINRVLELNHEYVLEESCDEDSRL